MKAKRKIVAKKPLFGRPVCVSLQQTHRQPRNRITLYKLWERNAAAMYAVCSRTNRSAICNGLDFDWGPTTPKSPFLVSEWGPRVEQLLRVTRVFLPNGILVLFRPMSAAFSDVGWKLEKYVRAFRCARLTPSLTLTFNLLIWKRAHQLLLPWETLTLVLVVLWLLFSS